MAVPRGSAGAGAAAAPAAGGARAAARGRGPAARRAAAGGAPAEDAFGEDPYDVLGLTEASEAEAVTRAYKAKRAQAHDDAARERVEQAHNAILMSQLSRRVADGAEEDVAFADRTPAVSWAPKYAPLEERDLMIGAAVLVGCNYLIKTSPNPGTYFLVAVAWYFYNLRKKIAGFIRSASDSKEDEREADGERTKRAIVVMAMFAGAGYALYTYGLPLLPKSVLVNLRPFVGKSPYSLLYSIVSLCAAVAACFFR